MRRILSALLALGALAGCQQETAPDEPQTPFRPSSGVRLRSVSVSLDSGQPSAKSVISVEAEGFRTAYLFVFDAATRKVFLDEEGRSLAMKTDSKTFNWSIPVGPDGAGNSQVMDVYAIVNPDADNTAILEEYLSGTAVTEAQLEALTYVCGNAVSLHSLETEGMPMAGCLKGISLESADEPFTLSIRRLFARYDIRLNVKPFSQGGWTLSAAEVLASHSNTRAGYFYTGSGKGVRASAQDLAMVDMATDSDLEKLNVVGADGISAGSLTLYFLENCQGDIGPASAWNQVYAELGDAVACCSYVEFVIRASHPSLGNRSFKYRFYPGQNDDMCSNFDIVRNVRKRITLGLSPDLSAEGFRWVYDGSLKVAPGEVLNVRYETSLDRDHVCLETLLGGLPADDLSVEVKGHFNNANAAHPAHATQYPNYGVVAVQARPDAPEGRIYQLKGGDASGQLSDQVNILVTMDVSFWKDVEMLYTPEYRGQWMVVRLPQNVLGVGENIYATVRNYVQQADGSYSSVNASYCTVDLPPDAEAFGNGKTGIDRPHIWWDPEKRLLFVYSHVSQPETDHYSTLTLSITGSDDGEEYVIYSKDYYFRQKEAVLRLKTSLSSESFTYRTSITTEGEVTRPPELYFVLADPEKGNRIIPNEEFLWGGHGQWQMHGMSPYSETFLWESVIGYSYDGASGIGSQFSISYPEETDPDSWDFNVYNLSITPRVQADFPYADNRYITFRHSFFRRGEVHVHPTCELLAAPKRSLTLMQPYAGTNDYSAMQCSASEAPSEFYLLYGFRQSYFVRMENLPGITPSVSLSRASSSAPYLRYSLTEVSAGLFRLDCWIDHYESPLSYNGDALPYSPRQTTPDPNDGDKDVTLTLSATYYGNTYSDFITCHVLHKRFRVGLDAVGQQDLQVRMWNPLGLSLSASATVSAAYRMYWYRHPLKEMFDGPCFNTQSVSFSLSASLASSTILGRDIPARLEKGSQDLRGIRCTYARDVHPDFIAAGFQVEDLILYYPAAEATSLSGNLSLSSEGFVSSVAGLSWMGSSPFNLEDYISYYTENVSFQYTLGTLSEYYLQALFYEIYDIWYYDYRFATPVHWSQNCPEAPIHFTSNAPLHIGGPDTRKTVSGNFLYRGSNSFHANDPVIGE